MKTIFLTIFEGVEIKNILRTDVFKNLLNQNIRVVLFTKSQLKVDYYAREFSDPNVIFEIVEWKSPSGLDHFFSKLKFTLLRTETTNIKRKMAAEVENKYINYYFGTVINYIFARPFIRRISRHLDLLFVVDNIYKNYFNKYQPNLVFMAHLFDEVETSMLREAKKRKITTIGLINSWDKVTARCIMRLLPDKAIVFNDVVKQELISYNDMEKNDIFVSGLPQYDILYNRVPCSREDFFKKICITPTKKLIVYAPLGRAFSSADWDMIDFLSENIPLDSELLVRFQPNDFVAEEEIKKRPLLVYDRPGTRFGSKRGVDWDMSYIELEHLHDTLYHMSLLICYASSISIDAAVLDKPVININFAINRSKTMIKSPMQYYKFTHYKGALKTGGIDLVYSKDDLISAIAKYLESPDLKNKERKLLVKQQIGFTDGQSGKRISDYILKILYNKNE